MAPAGSRACLVAAIRSGADAVYFGVGEFNMRSNYRNFTPHEMGGLAEECHKAGKRAYLALNTIIHEHELGKIDRILGLASDAEIDAVICSDLAVIAKASGLGLPVFLSTQMSLSNSEAIGYFHSAFGIRRFVLARECSLAQIRAIRRNLLSKFGEAAGAIEIEVFAHGAMCVSVSGRCFLSENRTGQSANRGACTQPCRREYQLVDDAGNPSFRMGDRYLLSPEDLCTMPFLEKLIDSGVASLKIEGRARTPEYVETVTRAYRRAVDFHFANRDQPGFHDNFQALKNELMEELSGVFHRGLSSGFFLGKPVDQWTQSDGNRATKTKRHVGEVVNFYRKVAAAEIRVLNAEFTLGDELIIQGPTTGSVRVGVASIQIDRQPVTCARRGSHVAVGVPSPVRANDRVFLVVPSQRN